MTAPSSSPRAEKPGRPGARWEAELRWTGEQIVADKALTGCQLEALIYAANGLTSSQIAARLGCGPDAVNLRIRYAATALGASSRTHAVALAIARGLIRPDEIHATKR